MANSDAATGFQAIRRLGGGELATNPYQVDASNGNTISKNDLVSAEADGAVTRSTANDGNIVIGAVQSIKDADGKPLNFLPASTAGEVQVYDQLDTVYVVQSDTGTVTTAADVFATANHVDAAGDSNTGLSNQELDASDIGTGLQARIIGLHQVEDNEFGENSKLEVVLNEQLFKGTASI